MDTIVWLHNVYREDPPKMLMVTIGLTKDKHKIFDSCSYDYNNRYYKNILVVVFDMLFVYNIDDKSMKVLELFDVNKLDQYLKYIYKDVEFELDKDRLIDHYQRWVKL